MWYNFPLILLVLTQKKKKKNQHMPLITRLSFVCISQTIGCHIALSFSTYFCLVFLVFNTGRLIHTFLSLNSIHTFLSLNAFALVSGTSHVTFILYASFSKLFSFKTRNFTLPFLSQVLLCFSLRGVMFFFFFLISFTKFFALINYYLIQIV